MTAAPVYTTFVHCVTTNQNGHSHIKSPRAAPQPLAAIQEIKGLRSLRNESEVASREFSISIHQAISATDGDQFPTDDKR